MPLLLRHIALDLGEPEEALPARAARRLKLPIDAVRAWGIVRRSLDARGGRVRIVYNLELALDSPRTERRICRRLHRADVKLLVPRPTVTFVVGTRPMPDRPIVIGFGPAGMFAALTLAEHGYRPIVLERGQPVPRRHVDVLKRFWRGREFDPESNLLFGEGGAGCYSDGKLRTRLNDPRVPIVLETFYRHGAPPDILVNSRPHIGSDRLPSICRRIRNRIERLGGEVRFGAKVTGFVLAEGRLVALRMADGSTVNLRTSGSAAAERAGGVPVLLGIGQSARDTFRALLAAGVTLTVKPFQVGVRVEHPQERINRWQYGAAAGDPRLPPAEYQVVAKRAAGDRGDVFSFCMCPGGTIVPCNESPGRVAVNGASRARRSSLLGNSGLVVTLGPRDVGGDPLLALATLERWEQTAFELAGGDYRVPVQRAGDFVAGRGSDGELHTSYPLGGQWCDLRRVLPQTVTSALSGALQMLDQRMAGFADSEAILAAPETRASCPLRVLRDETTRASVSADNLHPVGEGAGYAGGIVSAAVDGIRTAEVLIRRYAPPR